MSNYKVISRTGHTLRQTLLKAFKNDRELGIQGEQAISFENPTEAAKQSSNQLSIWLYHIVENGFAKNQPMRRRPDGSGQFPPLMLDLYYLITPLGSVSETNHLRIGKILELFYDNAILHMHDPAFDVAEQLRIVLCTQTIEELTSIWDSLQEPYRLSVCYRVSITQIDSKRLINVEPVVARDAEYAS
ncbi:MAG: DUF4255 domain-containing protein [Chloroflexota bacterium]